MLLCLGLLKCAFGLLLLSISCLQYCIFQVLSNLLLCNTNKPIEMPHPFPSVNVGKYNLDKQLWIPVYCCCMDVSAPYSHFFPIWSFIDGIWTAALNDCVCVCVSSCIHARQYAICSSLRLTPADEPNQWRVHRCFWRNTCANNWCCWNHWNWQLCFHGSTRSVAAVIIGPGDRWWERW